MPPKGRGNAAAAIRVWDDLIDLVTTALPDGGNTITNDRYGKSFITTLKHAAIVESTRKKAKKDPPDIKMDKETYVECGKVTTEYVQSMMRFLRYETDIWQRLNNKVHSIFSAYAMKFFDETDNEVKETVYNSPNIKQALIDVLITILVYWLTLGYAPLLIPKDIIKWIGFDSIWGNIYSPDLNTTKGHKVNASAMNRLPQRISQNSTEMLPFAVLDIEAGNLLEYFNVKTGSRVYMFQPTAPHTIALEKYHRTIVLVSPYAAPKNGEIVTGMHGIYKEWSRYRLLLTNYQRAVMFRSMPIIVADYVPGNTNSANMMQEELPPLMNRVDGDLFNMGEQEREYQVHQAVNRAAGPQTAKIIQGMLTKGTSKGERKPGVLTETRILAKNGPHHMTAGGTKAINTQEITAMEHDKMEYDAFDMSRDIGDMRSQITILMQGGTEFKSITPPEPDPISVQMAETRFAQHVDRLFDLLINGSNPNNGPTASGSNKASTATQIQASEMEQFRSQGEAMKTISHIFDMLYVEWGAMLDQFGLVKVLSTIQEDLRTANLMNVLKAQITESINMLDVEVDDVLLYLADPAARREISKFSKHQKKTLLPDSEGAQLVALTLENFKQWDLIIRSARGFDLMRMVIYRSLSQSTSSNLHLKFERRMEQFAKDGSGLQPVGKDGLQAGAGMPQGQPMPDRIIGSGNDGVVSTIYEQTESEADKAKAKAMYQKKGK